MAKTKDDAAKARKTITLVLPIAVTDSYVPRRIDMRMSLAEGLAFRRVFDGLRADGATLANGKHVDAVPDVVRWVAQKVYLEMYGITDPFSIVT